MTAIVAFVGTGADRAELVYHLAWMYADQGFKVLAADLDPAAALTSVFLSHLAAADQWTVDVGDTVQPSLIDWVDAGPAASTAPIQRVRSNLSFVPGAPSPGNFETLVLESLILNGLTDAERNDRASRVLSAPWHVLERAAATVDSDVVLVDAGAGNSMLSIAALVAAEHVVLSLGLEPYSIAGLHGWGTRLMELQSLWQASERPRTVVATDRPPAAFSAAGYVVTMSAQPDALRTISSTLPLIYGREVLHRDVPATDPRKDPSCLGVIRDYRSLAPLAREARKPIFQLTAADGALGSLSLAVQQAREDHVRIAERIAAATWRPPNPAETTP